jgi:hypothetical protein
MTMLILLSEAQADHVRGPSAVRPAMARLEPLPLTDGRFYLSVQVLADPDHAAHAAYLGVLPQDSYESIESLVPEP